MGFSAPTKLITGAFKSGFIIQVRTAAAGHSAAVRSLQ